MQCKGRLKEVTLSYGSTKTNLTFEIDNLSHDSIEAIKDIDLRIEAVKWRRKRSITANGMLWACIGEIANALGADKWDIYLLMLKRYGKYTYICVKPNVVEAVKQQWRECEEIGKVNINGTEAVQMLCYFGSSTYDTKEFSVLLDGVVSEMKHIGLQPPLTEDMKRVLEAWQKEKAY